MKIFLSHARKDRALASDLARRLRDQGFTVWLADEEINPGDNWAKKTGKALDESERMVILLTPGAMASDWVRSDIEFAISSRKYEARLYSVFVGAAREVGKHVPWILLKLPHRQVGSAKDFAKVVKDIGDLDALYAKLGMSHANA